MQLLLQRCTMGLHMTPQSKTRKGNCSANSAASTARPSSSMRGCLLHLSRRRPCMHFMRRGRIAPMAIRGRWPLSILALESICRDATLAVLHPREWWRFLQTELCRTSSLHLSLRTLGSRSFSLQSCRNYAIRVARTFRLLLQMQFL